MQKGFGLIPVVIILLVGMVVGAFAWGIFANFVTGGNVQTYVVPSARPVASTSAAVGVSASPSASIDPTEGWKVYENKRYNYIFKYPAEYTVNVANESALPLNENYSVIVQNQNGVTEGSLPDSMYVSVLSNDGSYVAYNQDSQDSNEVLQKFYNLAVGETKNLFPLFGADGIYTRLSDQKIDGHAAKVFSGISTARQTETRFYFQNGDKTYLIGSYIINPDQSQFKKTFDGILSTFRFIN